MTGTTHPAPCRGHVPGMLMAIGAEALLGLGAVVWWCVLRAPEGHEDRDGFCVDASAEEPEAVTPDGWPAEETRD